MFSTMYITKNAHIGQICLKSVLSLIKVVLLKIINFTFNDDDDDHLKADIPQIQHQCSALEPPEYIHKNIT